MVNLKYVKDQRKKKVAAWISIISTIVVIAFMILAFLGRSVGSFTVALKKASVELAMDTNRNFLNETTVLKINSLPTFDLCTNNALPKDEVIDTEETSYRDIGVKLNPETNEVLYMYFLKYTFYIKNVGTSLAAYDLKLKIVDNVKATNVSYTFDDILRVRLYSNSEKETSEGIQTAHDYKTYAKRVRTQDQAFLDKETQTLIYNSPIAGEPIDDDFAGFADMFLDDYTIAHLHEDAFKPGEIRRYTMVCWLEGTDYECNDEAPDNGSIKLGIDIDAYQG